MGTTLKYFLGWLDWHAHMLVRKHRPYFYKGEHTLLLGCHDCGAVFFARRR